MLRSTRKSSKSSWKVFLANGGRCSSSFKCSIFMHIKLCHEFQVLIMDKLTVKIMSFSCKMADITEEGVSCKWLI